MKLVILFAWFISTVASAQVMRFGDKTVDFRLYSEIVVKISQLRAAQKAIPEYPYSAREEQLSAAASDRGKMGWAAAKQQVDAIKRQRADADAKREAIEMQISALKEKAKETLDAAGVQYVFGTVLQVIDEKSIILEIRSARDSDIIHITGVKDSTLIDGDQFNGWIMRTGRYRYVNTLGVVRTISSHVLGVKSTF